MKAICVKTCYINDRYCEAGDVFELPDGFPLDYFTRLDEPEVAEVKVSPVTPSFKCEVCGKTFKAKIALLGHKRSHLGKKKEVT